VAEKKLSITGGVGASHEGEAYGGNYDLPNHPYNETCAAIANVYWNHRMFLLHGDAKYMDVLERALYNGVISGLSLDGSLFFYPNTLQHDGLTPFNQGVNGRSPWFDCSCCPSNLSRFVPSVAGYAYASRDDDLYVNLFMNSAITHLTDKGELKVVQATDYPWQGDVTLKFKNEKAVEANLFIRIPGWVGDQAVPSDLFVFENQPAEKMEIRVNGKKLEPVVKKGYALVSGKWQDGDQISFSLPMEARLISANAQVEAKRGLHAVQYGPLLYCAEEVDNMIDVLELILEEDSKFEAVFQPALLGGVNMLKGKSLTLIPYYAWSNRGPGKMNAWFK
jgi:DUF1680 family protein